MCIYQKGVGAQTTTNSNLCSETFPGNAWKEEYSNDIDPQGEYNKWIGF